MQTVSGGAEAPRGLKPAVQGQVGLADVWGGAAEAGEVEALAAGGEGGAAFGGLGVDPAGYGAGLGPGSIFVHGVVEAGASDAAGAVAREQ